MGFIVGNMITKKKKVLLCWYEVKSRPELLTPFTKMTDEIDFIHLYYRKRNERKEPTSPFEMIYWFDFKSPYHLLDEIRPDKVILPGGDDLLTISLIVACRNSGIRTFSMQHGYISEKFEEIFIPLKRRSFFSRTVLSDYKKIFLFYIRSLKNVSPKLLAQYLLLAFAYFRKGLIILKNYNYKWRMPDFYICFTKYSGAYYIERDKIPPHQVLEIGIPVFDALLQPGDTTAASKNCNNEKYYLLIDTSFVEHKDPVDENLINRCYRELSDFCNRNNAHLKIKLHPYNYEKTGLIQHPNISFYRNISDDELTALIKNAEGCFSFFSTLCIPTVCMNKLYQIKYFDVFFKELVDLGITPVLDFHTFTADEISFENFNVNPEKLDKFIRKYLYKADGRAAERLKSLLLDVN
jgi:Alpha-2,8-polysialyltransferase (POLYST)